MIDVFNIIRVQDYMSGPALVRKISGCCRGGDNMFGLENWCPRDKTYPVVLCYQFCSNIELFYRCSYPLSSGETQGNAVYRAEVSKRPSETHPEKDEKYTVGHTGINACRDLVKPYTRQRSMNQETHANGGCHNQTLRGGAYKWQTKWVQF